jgi:PKHD-type hydroxylase
MMQTTKLMDSKMELFVASDVVFTSEEIDRIIAQGKQLQADEAIVNTTDGTSGTVRPSSRTCRIGWFYPNEENQWLFDRIIDIIIGINDTHFGFDLNNFEPLQFASYDSSRKEFYGKHMDCTFGVAHKTASRKLSITVQLCSEDEYEGGNLKLYQSTDSITAPKRKGQLVVFPSFIMHEVTPVTKGTRYSLVTWVHGPKFK